MDEKLILTVTGHRPNKISRDLYTWNSKLSVKYIVYFMKYITKYCDENPDKTIVCRSGMALGIDTLFAIAALRVRNHGCKVELEACVPCRNQSCKWVKSSVDLYNDILNAADKVTYVSNEEYTPWCMQDRNVYMVDGCNKVLAVWDGTKGGTGNCVNYAKKVGVDIDIVRPTEISGEVA